MDKKIRLAETLKRRIISMELAPGAIVDEISLSEEFGISRSPVRELIRQMAAEGYLELEADRAARVSSMSHQSLRNFFLAAPLVYIATTQLAAFNAGQDNWRVRLKMAKLWVDKINQHGRHAQLVHLPKIGIYGNTHFPFSDLNNGQIAQLLSEWLKQNKLD